MEIKTIAYKRTRNLGNGESEQIEVTAAVDGELDAQRAIEFLKTCTNYLFIFTSSPNPSEEPQMADPI